MNSQWFEARSAFSSMRQVSSLCALPRPYAGC